MKLFDIITDDNFELFAANSYNNPHCIDVEEFQGDLNRFRYVKRLLGRYESCGDLQERLILNHLIVLGNVFGIDPLKKMLFFKVDEKHYPVIKPFLVFLHYLKEDELVETELDPTVVERLRNI